MTWATGGGVKLPPRTPTRTDSSGGRPKQTSLNLELARLRAPFDPLGFHHFAVAREKLELDRAAPALVEDGDPAGDVRRERARSYERPRTHAVDQAPVGSAEHEE